MLCRVGKLEIHKYVFDLISIYELFFRKIMINNSLLFTPIIQTIMFANIVCGRHVALVYQPTALEIQTLFQRRKCYSEKIDI